MASQSLENDEKLKQPVLSDMRSRKRKLEYTCIDSKSTDTDNPICLTLKGSSSPELLSGNTKTAKITPKFGNVESLLDKPTNSRPDPQAELRQLQLDLKNEEEHLRKLNMVKTYREKNNLEELEELINKWRNVCQESLQDLSDKLPAPRPALKELLDHLQIEHDLVHFDAENDCFS